MEGDRRSGESRTESRLYRLRNSMCITERNIFIPEYDMCLDEDIVSGFSSLEVVVSFEGFFSLEYLLNLSDFLMSQCGIEEHRDTTPDDGKRILHDPEGYPYGEYGIDPPDPEILREDEGYEDATIHHDIRGVVERI
jgi:hypothetical protein